MISDVKGSSLGNTPEPFLDLFQLNRGLTNGPFESFGSTVKAQGVKGD
jgi:hypothetical protein